MTPLQKIRKFFGFLSTKITGEAHKMQRLFEFADFLKTEGLAPIFHVIDDAATEPEVVLDGKKVLMFSSNNYLGLSMHPKVIKGAEVALAKNGIGPGGSRFLCGNIAILNELDAAVASLVGSEDAVTLPTGYMANVSIFKALMDPVLGILPYGKGEGVIFSDEFNHGSIVDGLKLSHAQKVIFKHSDLQDLESKLKKVALKRHKMIVTEGVFSPEGELSPLPAILALAERYNAILMVDDAHGIGVLGEHGGGAIEHFGLQGKIDIVMGSFDKALGGMGGFLATSKKLADYLRVSLRSNMLSSAVPGVMAGGVIESIAICRSEEGKILREKLFENMHYLRAGFEKMGFEVLGDGKIPVVPVLIGDEISSIKLAEKLLEYGVFSPSFRWPVVPKGKSRIRITPMATHGREQLDTLLNVFKKAKEEIKL